MEEDKTLVTREWLYTKILDASQKKYYGKLCGLVLAGGSGAGKTTFCRQMQEEKSSSRKHTLLRNKMIASYICPNKKLVSGSYIIQFLHSIYSQLTETPALLRFQEQKESGWLREAVDDPDDVFKRIILFPLLECEVQHKVVILLVDGLDLDSIPPHAAASGEPSKSIPELLSRHAHLFPRWLLPVFTTRQATAITAHFPGFRRISIDDLRKTQVIQDIQQFILARLQHDKSIARQITKDSTELLSLLHVKSAGCFLYIKKVLDGVSENYIVLEEIREIPGTLNGLYLWLCLKQFNKKNFIKVRPLVNILLASNSLSESELYEVVSIAGSVSSLETFQKYLIQLKPLLAKFSKPGENENLSLYHPSLNEWFTQTKFCGPLFACSSDDGKNMIQEWKNSKSKPDLVSGLEEDDSKMWMLLDTEERRKRKERKEGRENEKNKSLIDCVREEDLNLLSRLLRTNMEKKESEIDCAALVAAREGFSEALRILIDIGRIDPDLTDENGWTLLRTASWSGQEQCVKLLIDAGSQVNKCDGEQRTALRAACWAGHLECVRTLLDSGAEINHMDSEGRTSLIAACYMGHISCVRELIIWGADIEIMDQDGRTALSVAVTCDSESAAKLVTLLLDNGANPNQSDRDSMTPLLIAAFEGKANVCEILLENGADVDHADKEGKTALFAAASMGHLDILNILLFWGCYVDGIDCEGRTVLSVAAAEGSASVVQVLLDRGLDEQHRDNAGWGPLHYAAFEGHSIIVKLLGNAGAELDMTDCDGKTALHLSCSEGHYDVVVQLLRAGANVNLVNLQGRTPLRIALLEGSLDIAGLLLDNAADIDYIDTDSRSTLYIMALENDAKSVEFLLNHGANTELKDSDGRTALHVAAWQGYTDIVQVLLLNGADVNSVDGGNRSALLSACWQGHLHIADILLTAGAEVNQQCCQGASPLAVSAQEGHIGVLKLLLQHGADPTLQDHHGRDPYRVALRNNNAVVAEILEKYMKRLSDYRGSELSRGGLEDDLESPLYACPTSYGYAKIGENRSRSMTPGKDLQATGGSDSGSQHASDFTFGHTGHMAIILGRNEMEQGASKPSSGIFENIKEKAKNGFSATKRNFL